jgi:peptidoglycan hydrolase-like protein with peptidoglycan-binding domain
MALKYPPFTACLQLQQASRGSPSLGLRSHGPGVALVQGALLDLGYPLPLTMAKLGIPDGSYGHETCAAVRSFQTKSKLKPDTVAGPKTIAALDAAMVKQMSPAPPSQQPGPVLPVSSDYEVGTGAPPLGHDPGAGSWKSTPREVTYVALKASIVGALPIASVVVGVDAAKHMAHYLGNSGGTYTVDLESMVRDVPSARSRYEDEVAQMQEFVEKLPAGRYDFRSRMAENGYNGQLENRNWYFAIGGYSAWGEGNAVIKNGPGTPEYEVAFQYKFYDRYNWDAGKKVTFGGVTVTDHFMGEFHRQGLAMEFDCVGSFQRRLTWKKGSAIPASQIHATGGR